MFRVLKFNNLSILKCQKKLFMKWKNWKNIAGPSYFSIPDMPNSVAGSKSGLDVHPIPRFENLGADKVFDSGSRLVIDFETKLSKLVEDLADSNYEKTFDSVLGKVEEISVPLDAFFQFVKGIPHFQNDRAFQLILNSLNRKVVVTKMERWSKVDLYKACLEVNSNRTNLNEFEKGLLDYYLSQFELHGITLGEGGQDALLQSTRELLSQQELFRQRIETTSSNFRQLLDKEDLVGSTPAWLKARLSTGVEGRYMMTLTDVETYMAFMVYCANPQIRRAVWTSYNQRAGQRMFGATDGSNHSSIRDIRLSRRKIARTLGLPNWAELASKDHMAGSVETVMSLIDAYKLQYKEKAKEELNILNKWAGQRFGLTGALQAWDIPFMAHQYNVEHMNLDMTPINRKLVYPQVFHSLLDTCGRLFNLDIVQDTSLLKAGELPAPGVEYFRVLDATSKEELGAFYVDAWLRPGKLGIRHPVAVHLLGRSSLAGVTPLSAIVLNLPSSGATSAEVFVPLSDVSALAHAVGSTLQQVCTRADLWEVTGQNNIPEDAKQMVGALLRRLLHSSPAFFNRVVPGVPEDLSEALSKDRKPISALLLMEELYHAAFDLEMWVSERFWRDVQEDLWREFLPYDVDSMDEWPCASLAIFGQPDVGGRGSAVYADLWTATVAADVANAFLEAGLDKWAPGSELPLEVRAVSGRFRDTFLSLGGAVPPSEVFRRFRGRNPIKTAPII